MKNLFIGQIFIFLDFFINFNEFKLSLIPDFVGYILILKGLKELTHESNHFKTVQPFVLGMSIYTGILFLMDLFGIGSMLGVFSWFLGIISMIIRIYITYRIIMGIKDIEKNYSLNCFSEKLEKLWLASIIISLISYILIIIPILALLSLLVNFILSIIYLITFNKTKNSYLQFIGQ